MKRFSFLIATVVMALSSGISTAFANQITNGNFETGNFYSWTTFTTSNGILSPTVSPFNTNGYSVSSAASFRVGEVVYDRTEQGGGISQSFFSNEGAVTISADIAALNSGGLPGDINGDGGLFSLILDSMVVSTWQFGEIVTNQPQYASLAYAGAISSGTHQLAISVNRAYKLSGVTGYIDNVNVTQATAIPEPSALLLLSIGFAGLIGVFKHWEKKNHFSR